MKKIVLLLGVCLLAAPLSGYGFQDEISSADPELEALGAGNGRLVWSDSFTLNTEDLGETFELTVTDKKTGPSTIPPGTTSPKARASSPGPVSISSPRPFSR